MDRNLREKIQSEIDASINAINDNNVTVTYFNLISLCGYLVERIKTGKLNDEFKAKHQTTFEKIEAYEFHRKENEKLANEHQGLLKKEKELREELAEKEAFNKRLLELKGIKEAINNLNTDKINNEIIELEKNNGTNYQRFVQLIDKANEQLQNINGLVESNPSVATLKQNCETLKKQEVNILEMLTDDLKQLSSIVDIEEKTLNSNINEYNSCLEKLKNIRQELGLVAEIHPKNLEIWNNHFSTNKSIWGNLENTENNLQKHVNSLNSTIEKNLKEYDSILKELIQQNEKKPFFEIHK